MSRDALGRSQTGPETALTSAVRTGLNQKSLQATGVRRLSGKAGGGRSSPHCRTSARRYD